MGTGKRFSRMRDAAAGHGIAMVSVLAYLGYLGCSTYWSYSAHLVSIPPRSVTPPPRCRRGHQWFY